MSLESRARRNDPYGLRMMYVNRVDANLESVSFSYGISSSPNVGYLLTFILFAILLIRFARPLLSTISTAGLNFSTCILSAGIPMPNQSGDSCSSSQHIIASDLKPVTNNWEGSSSTPLKDSKLKWPREVIFLDV